MPTEAMLIHLRPLTSMMSMGDTVPSTRASRSEKSGISGPNIRTKSLPVPQG